MSYKIVQPDPAWRHCEVIPVRAPECNVLINLEVVTGTNLMGFFGVVFLFFFPHFRSVTAATSADVSRPSCRRCKAVETLFPSPLRHLHCNIQRPRTRLNNNFEPSLAADDGLLNLRICFRLTYLPYTSCLLTVSQKNSLLRPPHTPFHHVEETRRAGTPSSSGKQRQPTQTAFINYANRAPGTRRRAPHPPRRSRSAVSTTLVVIVKDAKQLRRRQRRPCYNGSTVLGSCLHSDAVI